MVWSHWRVRRQLIRPRGRDVMRLTRWWTTSSRPPRRSSVTSRTPSAEIPPCECTFPHIFYPSRGENPAGTPPAACFCPRLLSDRPKIEIGPRGVTKESVRPSKMQRGTPCSSSLSSSSHRGSNDRLYMR